MLGTMGRINLKLSTDDEMVWGPFMYLFLLFYTIAKSLKPFFSARRMSNYWLATAIVLTGGLSGCTGLSTSALPTFGFGVGSYSKSPDCVEIEKRMQVAHREYAMALRRERPAIYLTVTGNLSRTMKKNRLTGLYQMTDYYLDEVVDRTSDTCVMASLNNQVCQGASRLGRAYKPLVQVAREAHENYCGGRPIR